MLRVNEALRPSTMGEVATDPPNAAGKVLTRLPFSVRLAAGS